MPGQGQVIDRYKQKLPRYYAHLPRSALDQLTHTDEAIYSVTPFVLGFNVAQITNFIMT